MHLWRLNNHHHSGFKCLSSWKKEYCAHLKITEALALVLESLMAWKNFSHADTDVSANAGADVIFTGASTIYSMAIKISKPMPAARWFSDVHLLFLVFKGSAQSSFLPLKRATADHNQSKTDLNIEGTELNHLGPVFCSPWHPFRPILTVFFLHKISCTYINHLYLNYYYS